MIDDENAIFIFFCLLIIGIFVCGLILLIVSLRDLFSESREKAERVKEAREKLKQRRKR